MSLYDEVNEIIQKIVKNRNNKDIDTETVKRMYELNNILFPGEKEYGIGCSNCQSRVFEKLLKWCINHK